MWPWSAGAAGAPGCLWRPDWRDRMGVRGGMRNMGKQVISTTKIAQSALPLSHATLAGKLLFIGGAVAMNERGGIVGKGDIRMQTRQALENIKSLVETAGGTMRDVTKMTVYLTDLENYAGMNEVYRTYF